MMMALEIRHGHITADSNRVLDLQRSSCIVLSAFYSTKICIIHSPVFLVDDTIISS